MVDTHHFLSGIVLSTSNALKHDERAIEGEYFFGIFPEDMGLVPLNDDLSIYIQVYIFEHRRQRAIRLKNRPVSAGVYTECMRFSALGEPTHQQLMSL